MKVTHIVSSNSLTFERQINDCLEITEEHCKVIDIKYSVAAGETSDVYSALVIYEYREE